MERSILFMNSFLSYLLVFVIIVILILIAVFIGIKMRKSKDAKELLEAETEDKTETIE